MRILVGALLIVFGTAQPVSEPTRSFIYTGPGSLQYVASAPLDPTQVIDLTKEK